MKIEDIARIANVSKSAVSLALNGKPGVSEATRSHILKVVEEYNYKPLRSTRKKSQVDKKIIRFVACKNSEIITEHYQNLPFFSELMSYVSEGAKSSAYSLLISSIDAEHITEELKQLEAEHPSAGILLLGTNLTSEQIKLVKEIQPQLVVVDTWVNNLPVNAVSINNYLGGYQAAKYLLENGHRQIGYGEGVPRIENFELRKKGFFDTLREAGVSIEEHNVFRLPAMEINEQEAVLQALKNHDQLPTAIFCENDYMAISMIKTLHSLNIRVPEDISIIGFDNILESNIILPELTTIHVKKDMLTKQALKLLMDNIESGNTNDTIQVQVDTGLIVRNSVKKINFKQ
ncbi:LacI family DNA-binding transcriptional regulator [Amphibacillus sediminis]|uniref:LacI family DNA-binding transcriptional regulator n=1 Tax=Amphibacillus sediminis TaxID=360185 RepID=UPI00082C086D|nr:LacI family DNA-binding transcriptional regulator [Amphibacillus sediminis]